MDVCTIKNIIEICVLGIAFCMSKSKTVPLILIFFSGFMQLVFASNNAHLAFLKDNGLAETYTYAENLTLIYAQESFIMIVIAIVCAMTMTRTAFLASLIMMIQGICASLMGAGVALGYYSDVDMTVYKRLHGDAQDVFIVLYCLTAWICVYYSRKANDEIMD
jgi:hypothetical protein